MQFLSTALSVFAMLSPFIICLKHSNESVCVCECVENTCLAPTAAEWVRERASASELAGTTHVGALHECVCMCVSINAGSAAAVFFAHIRHTHSAKNSKICLCMCETAATCAAPSQIPLC